ILIVILILIVIVIVILIGSPFAIHGLGLRISAFVIPHFSFVIPYSRNYLPAMEPLHAPWRIEYILAPKPDLGESLFSRIAQSSDDAGNHVIARDRTCFAVLNTY